MENRSLYNEGAYLPYSKPKDSKHKHKPGTLNKSNLSKSQNDKSGFNNSATYSESFFKQIRDAANQSYSKKNYTKALKVLEGFLALLEDLDKKTPQIEAKTLVMLSFCYKKLKQPQNRIYALRRAKNLQRDNNLEWLKTSVYLVGGFQSISKDKEASLEIWDSFLSLTKVAKRDEDWGKKVIFCSVFAAEILQEKKKLRKIQVKCKSIVADFPALKQLKTYKRLVKALESYPEAVNKSQQKLIKMKNSSFSKLKKNQLQSLPSYRKTINRSNSTFKLKTLPNSKLTISNFNRTIFQFKANGNNITRNQNSIIPSRLSSPNHSSHKTTKNYRPQAVHPHKGLDEIIESKVKASFFDMMKKQEFSSIRKEMLEVQKEALKIERERLNLLKSQSITQGRYREPRQNRRDGIIVEIGIRKLNKVIKSKLEKIQKKSFQRIQKLTTDREIQGSQFQICINTHEAPEQEKMDTSIASSHNITHTEINRDRDRDCLSPDYTRQMKMKMENKSAHLKIEQSINTKRVHSGSGLQNKNSLITLTKTGSRNNKTRKVSDVGALETDTESSSISQHEISCARSANHREDAEKPRKIFQSHLKKLKLNKANGYLMNQFKRAKTATNRKKKGKTTTFGRYEKSITMKTEYQPKSESRLPLGQRYIALNQEADQLMYQNSSEKFQFIQSPKVSQLAKEGYKKEMRASMSQFKISRTHHSIKAEGNWSPAGRSPETPLAGPFLRQLTEKGSSYGNLSVQASKVSKEFKSTTQNDSQKLRNNSGKEIGKFSQTINSLASRKLHNQPSFVLEESKNTLINQLGSFEDLPALDKKESLISRKFEKNVFEVHQNNSTVVQLDELSSCGQDPTAMEKEVFRVMNQTIEKNKIRQEFSLLPLHIKVLPTVLTTSSYLSACTSSSSVGGR